MSEKGLIADIGGTNARFSLCDLNGKITDSLVLQCRDYPSLTEAVRGYFEKTGNDLTNVKHAAMAIACPVLSDEISMTNCDWRFSKAQMQKDLGLDSFALVNDFIAQALAVPCLKADEKVKIGAGEGKMGFPVAVIGPGTGLGVSILIPSNNGDFIPVASEGGHATIPATNDKEAELLAVLRRTWGHVSAERVVSGMGLVNVYGALRVMNGLAADEKTAAEISGAAVAGDALCRDALMTMFAFLGTLAGNVTLTAGALGGVYLAGGILPRKGVLELFKASEFRNRFASKGRFQSYLENIPTYVMTAENPAFLGLAHLVRKKIV